MRGEVIGSVGGKARYSRREAVSSKCNAVILGE